MWRRGPDGEIERIPASADVGADLQSAGDGGESAHPRRRARLLRALRLGFRDAYDHIGAGLLLSFLVSAGGAAALTGGWTLGQSLGANLGRAAALLLPPILGFLGLVLVGAPLTAGLYYYCRRACAREEPALTDLVWAFRAGLRPALLLGGLHGFALVVAGGSCLFYLAANHPLAMLGAAVALYVFCFTLLMGVYAWPVLVEPSAMPNPSGLVALRKGALLALDNPGYTLRLVLVLAPLVAACWISVAGAVVLMPAGMAFLATQATRELLRRYKMLPEDPTLMPDEQMDASGSGPG